MSKNIPFWLIFFLPLAISNHGYELRMAAGRWHSARWQGRRPERRQSAHTRILVHEK
jgi:hypothetical protein